MIAKLSRRLRWPACAVLATSAAWAQKMTEQPAADEALEVQSTGAQRVVETSTIHLSPDELAERMAAGKLAGLDPATGTLAVERIHDFLPADWQLVAPKETAQPGPVDSYGNPIVNESPRLPAWSQRDVDGLRAAIRRHITAPPAYTPQEIDWVLGNYIGQAIVRDIDIDAVVNMRDRELVNAQVMASVAEYLAYYERIKRDELLRRDAEYTPTAYSPEAIKLLTEFGYDPAAFAAPADPAAVGMRGLGGCMNGSTFGNGITLLSDETLIWDGTVNADDSYADITIGFPNTIFYYCDDADTNSEVRVSTNGYITFAQQGGGAIDGTDWTNNAIPDTINPDGYAAPWWDDLIVDADNGDTIGYKTEGATGSRVFTVQWSSVSHYNVDELNFYWFQVKLFEHSDTIQFHYGLWNGSSGADGATVGIENFDGTDGVCGPNCGASNADEPPNNYTFAPGRPLNNICLFATPLPIRGNVVGSLINASRTGTASCGFNAGRDLWYRFTAPCAGTFTADTCGTNDAPGVDAGMDTVLSLHAGCFILGDVELDCNDDYLGCPDAESLARDSLVSTPMVADQPVFVRVSHFNASLGNGAFQLHTEFVPDNPIPNDTCATAQQVFDGSIVAGNLNCASASDAEPCGFFGTNRDAWYRFTAPQRGLLRVSTCGTHDSPGVDDGMDTILGIYNGCGGGGPVNLLDCNDDGNACGPAEQGFPFDSFATAPLTAGQTVYIGVTHYSTSLADGQFTLYVNLVPRCPNDPSGSDCDSDLNGDCIVNNNDLGILLAAYLSELGGPRYNPTADLWPFGLPDGVINNNDLGELLADYLNNCN